MQTFREALREAIPGHVSDQAVERLEQEFEKMIRNAPVGLCISWFSWVVYGFILSRNHYQMDSEEIAKRVQEFTDWLIQIATGGLKSAFPAAATAKPAVPHDGAGVSPVQPGDLSQIEGFSAAG